MKLISLAVSAAALSLASAATAQEKLADLPEDGTRLQFPLSLANSELKREFIASPEADREVSRVLNGSVAAPGAFPFQVALMVETEPNMAAQFCGGSMIQTDVVLTAAHCVVEERDDGYYVSDPSKIYGLVGTVNIAEGGDFVRVSKITVHPDYNPRSFDSDVALLKLERKPKVPFDVIKIPTESYADQLEQPGTESIVVGWGRTETGKSSHQLMEGRIKVLPRAACNDVFLSGRRSAAAKAFATATNILEIPGDKANQLWADMNAAVPLPVTENMICAGTPVGPRGACDGDSGGPLMLRQSDGTLIQAGVVSWGLAAQEQPGCERNAKFSMYTRMGNYTDWVLTELGYK
ncbi:MAG: serine protease [Pseudomonadota bacterium]